MASGRFEIFRATDGGWRVRLKEGTRVAFISQPYATKSALVSALETGTVLADDAPRAGKSAKRAPAKKAPAKKAPAKKAPAKKTPAKKTPVGKKAPAKKTAPAKKAPAKEKVPAKKTPTKRKRTLNPGLKKRSR